MTAIAARAARLAGGVLAAALATGCIVQAPATNSDGTITIDNASSHVLTVVRIAPVDQIGWGPDLLPDVLYPNEVITVLLSCDSYDVMVTDDRQRDCVVGNLDLCFSDRRWIIDNTTLRNCGY